MAQDTSTTVAAAEAALAEILSQIDFVPWTRDIFRVAENCNGVGQSREIADTLRACDPRRSRMDNLDRCVRNAVALLYRRPFEAASNGTGLDVDFGDRLLHELNKAQVAWKNLWDWVDSLDAAETRIGAKREAAGSDSYYDPLEDAALEVVNVIAGGEGVWRALRNLKASVIKTARKGRRLLGDKGKPIKSLPEGLQRVVDLLMKKASAYVPGHEIVRAYGGRSKASAIINRLKVRYHSGYREHIKAAPRASEEQGYRWVEKAPNSLEPVGAYGAAKAQR